MNIRSFRKVGVAIIGGGTGGLSAAHEVSGCTDDYLLIGQGVLSILPPRLPIDGPPDPPSLVAQGRVAGFNAVHRSLRRMPDVVPLSISFCDPNVAVVGESFSRLDADQTAIAKLRFYMPAQDRPSHTGGGMLKLYSDRNSSRLLGGVMIGPGYEHMAHLLAAFVQQRLTVEQALDMPFFCTAIEGALRSGLMALQRSMRRIPRCHHGTPVIRPSSHPRLWSGEQLTATLSSGQTRSGIDVREFSSKLAADWHHCAIECRLRAYFIVQDRAR